ncbi:hypothetical protein [Sunxiuqinia indica]|uniref:hypothetical protein n=1 Tax=Sunxiuqinia indica TaxID=2692584 RepID=UPI00135BF3B7|nr:hypothetical protein [Sunxiuqinia indica]
MNQLLSQLKSQDKKMWRMSRNFRVFYWIMIPVYTFLLVLYPSDDVVIIERLGGGCFVLSFVVFAVLFSKNAREFKTIDYSQPSVQMLESAVKRYRLWKPELAWALFAILFIDAGMVLMRIPRAESDSLLMIILNVQYVLVPLITGSFVVGIIWWYVKHKPLRDHALHLLNALKE